MKILSKQDVFALLERQDALKNSFLRQTVDKGLSYYSFLIEDEETFFSLVWHYHRHTKVLTPGTWIGGKVYSVGDVTDRFLALNATFSDYVTRQARGIYTPDWFESCMRVYDNFSWEKWGVLAVQLLNNTERRECPLGTFRLIDGSHRTLTLGVLLKEKKIIFKPIQCVLVLHGL